jgi:hypothetical protein
MKSLSIVVLLGSIAALVLGGLLAVTSVFADNSQAQAVAPAEAAAPIAAAPALAPELSQVAIPLTVNVAAETATDPGMALAQTFSVKMGKDTAAAEVAQAAAVSQANLASFVSAVSNGKSSQIVGIYVDGAFAYGVGRQPGGDASYVTENANEVTQFGLAAQYGSQAFLAHNYLAGAAFSALAEGQLITVVYGDGRTENFRISGSQRFQALSPDSTQSRFVDLATGEEISASTLFHTVYNNSNAVVLQTCIANGDVSTWGRLFITAVPAGDSVAGAATDSEDSAQAEVAVTGTEANNESTSSIFNLVDDAVETVEDTAGSVRP